MKRTLFSWSRVGIPGVLSVCLLIGACQSAIRTDVKAGTFRSLQTIRNRNKQQVVDYFEKLYAKAKGAAQDDALLRFFRLIKDHRENPRSGGDASRTLYEADLALDQYFVEHYGDFYDILFIDEDLFVFHSVKREDDYQKSLLNGKLATTELAKALKTDTEREFIDYHFYPPSEEAAAFFVVPVKSREGNVGRIILQLSINRVNRLLSEKKDLGRTGEVYLVNKQKVMLTESRFIEDSTVLKLKVDTEAVRQALEKGSGSRIVTDYRGVRVYSSYEQFEIQGIHWIILVEIDEEEVITQLFEKHRDAYLNRIWDRIAEDIDRRPSTPPMAETGQRRVRVDLNEFSQARSEELLFTNGVSSCTSVAIVYPDRFSYLAHISPTDDIYISNLLTRIFLRKRRTSFLSELLQRIRHYDIYPYEVRNLRFVAIATHSESIRNVVSSLLDQGVFLSQIKFLYNPQAHSANVALNQRDDSLVVEWISGWESATSYTDASEVKHLALVFREIIGYD